MNPLSFGKPFLTVPEAADLICCSVATIRRAIASRRLAVHKPNGKHGKTLIRVEDLQAWLSRGRVGAIGEDSVMADYRKA